MHCRYFRELEREMDNVFRSMWGPVAGDAGAPAGSETSLLTRDFVNSMAIDLKEDDKSFIFHADVPGLSKENVKV